MTDYEWNLHHENDKIDKLQEQLNDSRELIEKLQNILANETRIRQYYVNKCVQLGRDIRDLKFSFDAFGGFLLMIRAPKQVMEEFMRVTKD